MGFRDRGWDASAQRFAIGYASVDPTLAVVFFVSSSISLFVSLALRPSSLLLRTPLSALARLLGLGVRLLA